MIETGLINSNVKTVEWYAVSFLDILGQKNKLTILNNRSISKEEIKIAISHTYGNIQKLRHNIKETYATFEKKTITNNPKYDSNKIKINSFSDAVVNYISLRDDINKIPFNGIYNLLLANGVVFLLKLYDEIPIRGGIDIGRGIEFNTNGYDELYGTALSNPYYIESNIADYPRIVIGKRLYEHIYITSKITSNKENDKINRGMAEKCLNLIIQDKDGEYIIHYLSEIYQKIEGFDIFYKKAELFINNQLILFNNKQSIKEYEKYKKLIKYFETYGVKK